jgi:nucleoporin POM152
VASWALALTKIFYDRELAIAEIRVKPANILHNSSLILGKQIIHILPEGLV